MAKLVEHIFRLQVHKAVQQLEPVIGLEHLVPQILGGVALFAINTARLIVTGPTRRRTPVEGQEEGILAGQFGGHRHFKLIYGEMHQRPALELQQRLVLAVGLGLTVIAVLLLGVLQALLEAGFQLQRGYRQAIDEQSQIDAAIVAVGAVDQLRHYAQTVGGIALFQLGVEAVVGLEGGNLEAHAAIFDLVTQQPESALAAQTALGSVEQVMLRFAAIDFAELGPGIGLGFLHIGDQVVRVEGAFAVILARLPHLPALCLQRGDDIVLKCQFAAVSHDGSSSMYQLLVMRVMRALPRPATGPMPDSCYRHAPPPRHHSGSAW